MAIVWSDAALERSGMTREHAVLALANQLTDLRMQFAPMPSSIESGNDWDDLIVLPVPEPPKIVYTAAHIKRYSAMHSTMFTSEGR